MSSKRSSDNGRPAEAPRGGRPTVKPGVPSTVVSLRLPTTLHDAALARAKDRCGGDLSALLRRALEREVYGFVSQNPTVIKKTPY